MVIIIYKLYVFWWYDAYSDNGYNEDYLITNDPKTHAQIIGHKCEYREFEQEGFTIKITKSKGGK